jgi:hypothetical protein
MADEVTFEMTASHLTRSMEQARRRERDRIAKYLDEQGDLADAYEHDRMHPTEVAQRFREAAEYVRSGGGAEINTMRVAAAPDPLLTMRDGPEAVDLPPERHLSDEDEAMALVRSTGPRSRPASPFPRD